MKIIKYDDIKTPETIEEFRTNLKKYFMCIKNDREQLFIQTDTTTVEVDVDSIENLSDLYHKLDTGVVRITPTIDFKVKSITTEEILGINSDRSFRDVYRDQSRFVIFEIENKDDVMTYMDNKDPHWYGIDNQVLRTFYAKTLGKFSGYELIKENTKIKVDKDIPIPPKRSYQKSESA